MNVIKRRVAQKATPFDIINQKKEDLISKAENKANKKTLEKLAKNEILFDNFESICKKFSERKWTHSYKGKKNIVTDRKLNLMLSDLHFGANLDPKLVNIPYGPVEESRRLASICKQVADYKLQHRDSTELEIHLIGDIIEGKIHDVEHSANLTQQFDRALHNLIYGIEFLATQFKKVTVRTAVGNHGRDVQRHPDRAMQDKYDSNEYRIYLALKYRFEKIPNIVMELPIRGYYIYEQFGMKGMMTHGDTIFKPGMPGKMIETQRLISDINSFRLSKKDYNDISLVGMGHVHTAMDIQAGDCTVITNGCLVPTDEYAQSIGIYVTYCSQQLWETVPGYMFGDHRRLSINTGVDTDKSLDNIIPAWTGL